jgi:hypothetical protein
MANIKAMIPNAPAAALIPMPAFAPGDKLLDACDVFVEELFEVGFEALPDVDVGVATFQPMSPMALISEEEVTVLVV